MIFGKYINRYYLRHAPALLLGILALLMVDYIQLLVPQLYRLVINGVNLGQVVVRGETMPFTKEVLFQHICLPMIWIVLFMVVGRFLWRICFFGSAVRVAADLRERMFDHSRRLSQQYYQVNKVGNLMSLYTNDLDTIQECFGDGVLMFFDALTLGLLALYKMWTMDVRLTLLALIPALIMFAIGTQMSKVMTRRWEERQEAFSGLSDFAQENFSGIAVIKAFVKEYKELQAFRKLNKENEEINVTYTKIATLLEVLVTLFVESVICIILGYGGYLVYQGRFNAGQLVEYIGYFEAIVWPIMAVSMLIEKTSRGKASLNRITELLDAPSMWPTAPAWPTWTARRARRTRPWACRSAGRWECRPAWGFPGKHGRATRNPARYRRCRRNRRAGRSRCRSMAAGCSRRAPACPCSRGFPSGSQGRTAFARWP